MLCDISANRCNRTRYYSWRFYTICKYDLLLFLKILWFIFYIDSLKLWMVCLYKCLKVEIWKKIENSQFIIIHLRYRKTFLSQKKHQQWSRSSKQVSDVLIVGPSGQY